MVIEAQEYHGGKSTERMSRFLYTRWFRTGTLIDVGLIGTKVCVE